MIGLERHRAGQIGGIPATHQAGAPTSSTTWPCGAATSVPCKKSWRRLGLSSLGRAESHVLATVNAVLKVLHRLDGRAWRPPDGTGPPVGFNEGIDRLDAHAADLLGPEPPERVVRIMVTMPNEASEDYLLVRELLERGMNCMRINCATTILSPGVTWSPICDGPSRISASPAGS